MSERVIVGMSGGVDSSVAAYLLKKQGYDVIGVTMQVWDAACSLQMEREGGCCGQSAVDDARRVCGVIGIPYYVIGFRDIFQKKVIDYFVDEYLHGRTPNPCLVCNRYVKWAAMLQVANEIGAKYVATGHYARILRIGSRYTIRNSVTAAKDQTYALYKLTQEQLSRTMMPIGDYHKSEVRHIAAEAGLPVAQKPDSEEVCFVNDDDYGGYIDRNAGDRVPPPGRFIYKDGTDLGPNRGITHYTIGQRRHLGIAMGHRVVVTGIDADKNIVYIGDDEDCWGNTLVCHDLNFMAAAPEDFPVGACITCNDARQDPNPGNASGPCTWKNFDDNFQTISDGDALADSDTMIRGKIRYGAKAVPCTLERTGEDEITAHFHEKVRAITPGQSAVFYEGDHILCGGVIA